MDDDPGPVRTMDGNGTVGVAEAASMCGISDDTVRRRIWDGSLKAVREYEPNGPWRIELSALVAAGLSPSFSGADEARRPARAAAVRRHPSASASTNVRSGDDAASDDDVVAELRTALMALTERAARAEALAEARAEHVATLVSLLSGRPLAGTEARADRQLSLYAAGEVRT